MKKKIRVLLLDDHELVRSSLKQLIESNKNIKVIGEASTGNECIELASSMKPDVILLDLSLNNQSGFEVAKRIISEHSYIKIIVVSMYYTEAFINLSKQIGISGFISKCSDKKFLFYAIQKVYSGETYFQDTEPQIGNFFGETMLATQLKDFKISKRELDVIRLVAEGFSSKEVALKLNVSVKTIENHRINMLKKSRTKNTIELLMALIKLKTI